MSEITVLRATKTVAPKGYDIVELAYKTDEGKTKGMKLFGFGKQKENSAVAAAALPGDVLDVTFQQNDKGYWEFGTVKATGKNVSIKSDAASSTSTGPIGNSTPSKGNWETSEERAARQVFIVRQSSVSNAIAYFEASKQKPTVEDVVVVAKQFEAYVFGNSAPVKQTGDVE